MRLPVLLDSRMAERGITSPETEEQRRFDLDWGINIPE
jgi:hypothetical protein